MSRSPQRNRYKIIDLLGRGGMSEVYKALDLATNQSVAVKVLRTDVRNSQELKARFLREIELGLDLDHPCVIQILDRGEIDRGPYYVMPFTQGISLHDALEQSGSFPLERTLGFMLQCADGLAAGVVALEVDRLAAAPHHQLAVVPGRNRPEDRRGQDLGFR